MASLIKQQNNKTVSKGMKTRLKQRLIIVVTLSLLLGLGWGLGIPATEGIDDLVVRTSFQIVFISLTAFQGLFIFIMHCVRVPDARKVWKHCFRLHSEGAYSKSTLTRSGGAGFVYNKALNKTGTLTTVTSGDSLRQSFEPPTFTQDAVSPCEASTLTDSVFSPSILESETIFNVMAEQDPELPLTADREPLAKGECRREAHTELKQEISRLPEMPIRQNSKKIRAVDELEKHNKVTGRLQSLKEEECEDTIFVNPAADLGKLSSAGVFHSAQLASMRKGIWHSTNPTFTLHLSGEEPRVERIKITKL